MTNISRPLIGINSGFTEYADYKPGDMHYKDRYQAFNRYMDAIAEAGGAPVMLPCLDDLDTLRGCVAHLNGFLFTGGSDYPPSMYGQTPDDAGNITEVPPRRVAVDTMLIKTVMAQGIPILGICLGCQLVNIADGGQLIQNLETADNHKSTAKGDAYHTANLEPGSWLHDVFKQNTITINSCHHQAVSPKFVGRNLRVVARAMDGTIEAIQGNGSRFVLGVQWHPERINDAGHRQKLMGGFVKQCQSAMNHA